MSFRQAIAQLRQQLAEIDSDAPGCMRITVPLTQPGSALCWLAAQRCWPQFYWQHRSGKETFAACGARETYCSVAQASLRLSELPAAWQIFGAKGHDGESYFFLPLIVWQQTPDGQKLIVNLACDDSLRQEAARLLDWLDNLHLPQTLPSLPHYLTVEHLPRRRQWDQQIGWALQAIHGGELQKVVLARVSDYHCAAAPSAAALLAASQHINPHSYHFLLAVDGQQAFIGSSPERLYARRENQFYGEALAGTAGIDQQGLLTDEKNQWENRLVMDDICQQLQGLVSGLEVSAAELLPLRQLQHLRRNIRAELLQTDDAQCVAALQPTAAVNGLPRRAARDFILQHEPFERGWYSGSIGYLSQRQSEFAVALRCARIRGWEVRLYAGAGIVSGSQAGLEWQEIERKTETLGCCLRQKNEA